MQPVAAAAGGRIVERKAQVVAAQEPLEGEPGFVQPVFVVRGAVGFDAGRHRGVGLDRLLVELGGRFAARIEAVAADRAEEVLRRVLHLAQPAERVEADIQRLVVTAPPPAENQCMRRLGVVVDDDVFEPGPVVGGGLRGRRAMSRVGQFVADLVGEAVAAQAAEILVDAEQRECPGAERVGWRARR